MTRRISVRGIVWHNGSLLAVRLRAYKDYLKQDNSYWCLPGGGLEDGESLVDGVAREMLEETGVAPNVGRLLYIQQFTHGEKEYLEFFFHITNGQDYEDIDLSNSTHGLEEIEEIELIDPASVKILPKFLGDGSLGDHILSETPVKIISLM